MKRTEIHISWRSHKHMLLQVVKGQTVCLLSSCLFLTFSSAVNSGAESFIDVRILSSSLEAKLTVCFCALHGDEEVLEPTIVRLLNRRLKV